MGGAATAADAPANGIRNGTEISAKPKPDTAWPNAASSATPSDTPRRPAS